MKIWQISYDDESLVRHADRAVYRLSSTPSESASSWRWGFSPDGTELWGVEIQALRLHRFELPSKK